MMKIFAIAVLGVLSLIPSLAAAQTVKPNLYVQLYGEDTPAVHSYIKALLIPFTDMFTLKAGLPKKADAPGFVIMVISTADGDKTVVAVTVTAHAANSINNLFINTEAGVITAASAESAAKRTADNEAENMAKFLGSTDPSTEN